MINMSSHRDSKSDVLSLNETYNILEKIGSGGFSSIYRVRTQSGTIYAVKFICSKGRGIPCLMEPSIMMSYQHPYLNSAHFVEVKGDQLYIFMDESICNLYEWRKNHNFDITEFKRSTYCILQALAFLHREGILHGDIKASNVLVFPNGIYKLTDFNLSCRIGWKSKSEVCSANMRPLEAWMNEWDEKVDIWALGCTLYFLWFDHHLFLSQNDDRNRKLRYLLALLDWRDMTIGYGDDSYKPEIHRYMLNIPQNLEYNPPDIKRALLFSDNVYLNIIRSMLKMDPELRPTAGEVLEYNILSNNDQIKLGNIRRLHILPVRDRSRTPPLVEHTGEARYNIINMGNPTGIMSKYSSNTEVVELSQRLYDRYRLIKPDEYEDHILCITILWMAKKLMHDHRYKVPSCAKGLSYTKICEIERDIFRTLGSMLH